MIIQSIDFIDRMVRAHSAVDGIRPLIYVKSDALGNC